MNLTLFVSSTISLSVFSETFGRQLSLRLQLHCLYLVATMLSLDALRKLGQKAREFLQEHIVVLASSQYLWDQHTQQPDFRPTELNSTFIKFNVNRYQLICALDIAKEENFPDVFLAFLLPNHTFSVQEIILIESSLVPIIPLRIVVMCFYHLFSWFISNSSL